jgi:transcriptional regulator with XRE-family HTH domain
MSPSQVRRIRKGLGLSQHDFARVLWVTYSTLSRWERGLAVPFGMHLQILRLLDQAMAKPRFKSSLQDPRAEDPLFLLHQLLEPLYKDGPSGAR